MNAYITRQGGSLEMTQAFVVDGDVYIGAGIGPLTPTDQYTELKGWPDSKARIYKTDGGVEVLIARKSDQ